MKDILSSNNYIIILLHFQFCKSSMVPEFLLFHINTTRCHLLLPSFFSQSPQFGRNVVVGRSDIQGLMLGHVTVLPHWLCPPVITADSKFWLTWHDIHDLPPPFTSHFYSPLYIIFTPFLSWVPYYSHHDAVCSELYHPFLVILCPHVKMMCLTTNTLSVSV